MTRRARNLTDSDIATILSLLDGWTGRLSWDSLTTSIEARTGQSYTRQALSKHPRILSAFQLRKKGPEARREERVESPELEAALQRIARLEAENTRLDAEKAALLEQFARWAYNAHARGLQLEMLNRPLPPVDRDQTRQGKGRHK